MISRQWRGTTSPSRADDYVAYLRTRTLPALRGIPGFLGFQVLRRDGERGTEFLVMTEWASLDAVRRFAGPEPERAVVPPEVQEMMVEFDAGVRHYHVVEAEPSS